MDNSLDEYNKLIKEKEVKPEEKYRLNTVEKGKKIEKKIKEKAENIEKE